MNAKTPTEDQQERQRAAGRRILIGLIGLALTATAVGVTIFRYLHAQ